MAERRGSLTYSPDDVENQDKYLTNVYGQEKVQPSMGNTAELYKNLNSDEGLKTVTNEGPTDSNAGVGMAAGKAAAQGASQSMNAGGGIGQALTGAGTAAMFVPGGAPYGAAAVGAGLLISKFEGDAKAEAQHERDVAKEAQDRKLAVQNALTQQLGAARAFGVV